MGMGMGIRFRIGIGPVVVGTSVLRSVLWRLQSILCGSTCCHPAAASGICPAGPAARGTELLVLLLEPSGLLSIREKVSWRMDEGCAAFDSAGL